MNYIKYLILFGIVLSNVTIYQQANSSTNNNNTIVTVNNILGSDKTRYLAPNITQSINSTLEEGITKLYNTLSKTPQNQWYNISGNAYYSLSKYYYSYIRKLITNKIINNVSEIEYIWKSLLSRNKKLVDKLIPKLEQYAEYHKAPTRLQSISKKVQRYPIDSLQSIINFYMSELINKNSYNYTYLSEINKIFQSMSTTENPRWGAFVNCFRRISLTLAEIDKNLLPNDAQRAKNEILIEFKLNKAKILANILNLQQIPQTDSFHTFEVVKDHTYYLDTTVAPYKLPIIMDPIQKHIEQSSTLKDLADNINVYNTALNDLLSINEKIQSTEVAYIIYYINNNGYNNSWVVNYIENYVKTFIEKINEDTLPKESIAKLHKKLGAILQNMSHIPEWQTEYNKLVNSLNSINKSIVPYSEALYSANNNIIDKIDINNSEIFSYREIKYRY